MVRVPACADWLRWASEKDSAMRGCTKCMRPLFTFAAVLFMLSHSVSNVRGADNESPEPQITAKCFRVTVGREPSTFEENTYVVINAKSKDAIIIDPGVKDAKIDKSISAERLRVQCILNTHGHFDHIGGNAYYAGKYGVRIYAHAADKAFYLRRADPVKFFRDSNKLTVSGFKVEVLRTPGHSPGSVCYMIDGLLFSGDTLFKDSIGRTGGKTEEQQRRKAQQLIRVIKDKLLPLPDDTPVYPGHGEATTIGAEREHNPYLVNGTQ